MGIVSMSIVSSKGEGEKMALMISIFFYLLCVVGALLVFFVGKKRSEESSVMDSLLLYQKEEERVYLETENNKEIIKDLQEKIALYKKTVNK